MIWMDVFHAMHASFEDLIRTPLFGLIPIEGVGVGSASLFG